MAQDTRFSSKLGMIAAAAGSAVGLGNVWRFPSETADGGGAIFIIVFIACVLFFGVPLLMAEFIVGRSAHANATGAYHKLAPGKPWVWVGRLSVLTGFLIMGFYMVVCGWTLDYAFQSITFQLEDVTNYADNFNSLIQNPVRQVILVIIFTFLTALFIISGVKKGIEKSAKLFMPILFLFLIILGIRSITLEGASEGLAYLFRPNIQNVKPTIFLDAMGQAFLSLSIGMGCMTTYASYFKDDAKLGQSAIQVSVLDTLVSILAGIMIFPSAFAISNNPEGIVSELVAGGPGLLFISLPELLSQLPLPTLWSSLFFFLLLIAALTSTISLMEVVTLYVNQELKLSRKTSTLIVSVGVVILGVIASFSTQFFDFLDFTSAKILLPVGGLFISLFVGWYLDKSLVESQITNNGNIKINPKIIKTYVFILRYIAPIAILAILIYGLFG